MVTLAQVIEDLDAGLVIAAEPVIFYKDPRWWYSKEKRPKVGIYWRKLNKIHAPAQLIKNGADYVLVKWNKLYIMGCYFSPNRAADEFSRYVTVAARLAYETAAPSDGEWINACSRIACRSPGSCERDLLVN
jgi:hypothetical protein